MVTYQGFAKKILGFTWENWVSDSCWVFNRVPAPPLEHSLCVCRLRLLPACTGHTWVEKIYNMTVQCAKFKCIKIFMTIRCQSPSYHCSMFHLETSTWIGPGECWFMLRLPPNPSEQLWVQWEKVRSAGIPVWEEGPRDLQPFIGPGIPACAVQLMSGFQVFSSNWPMPWIGASYLGSYLVVWKAQHRNLFHCGWLD